MVNGSSFVLNVAHHAPLGHLFSSPSCVWVWERKTRRSHFFPSFSPRCSVLVGLGFIVDVLRNSSNRSGLSSRPSLSGSGVWLVTCGMGSLPVGEVFCSKRFGPFWHTISCQVWPQAGDKSWLEPAIECDLVTVHVNRWRWWPLFRSESAGDQIKEKRSAFRQTWDFLDTWRRTLNIRDGFSCAVGWRGTEIRSSSWVRS